MLLVAPPDLADDHELSRVAILLEQLHHVGERQAKDGVAADADDRRLPKTRGAEC